MGSTRKLFVIAVVAAVLLTGCQTVTRVTSSTYQDAIRCMIHSLSGDGRWLLSTPMGDPSGIRPYEPTVLHDLSNGTKVSLTGSVWTSGTGRSISDSGTRLILGGGAVVGNTAYAYVMLWSRSSQALTRISPANESVTHAAISGNGRKVIYTSQNLRKLWIYDVDAKVRTEISRPAGIADTVEFSTGDVSYNGRYVVLQGGGRRYVVDLTTKTSVTIPMTGLVADSARGFSLSDDGRYLAFAARPAGTPWYHQQVYRFDRTTAQLSRLTNVASDLGAGMPSMSGDGTKVGFVIWNHATSVYQFAIHDRATNKVAVHATANRPIQDPVISDDGAKASFCSSATDLVKGSPAAPNVYVWG